MKLTYADAKKLTALAQSHFQLTAGTPEHPRAFKAMMLSLRFVRHLEEDMTRQSK